MKPETKFGEGHPRSRFSDSEIENMRTLAETGMKFSTIMEKFGISKGHLSKVLRFVSRGYAPG